MACLLALGGPWLRAQDADRVFEVPEPVVTASPGQETVLVLPGAQKVPDFDVSPLGGQVAVLVQDGEGTQLGFWRMGESALRPAWKAPQGCRPLAVVWHPTGACLFVTAQFQGRYHIFRLERRGDAWVERSIFNTPGEIRRVLLGPCPFVQGYEPIRTTYRLFFGLASDDGAYRTVSITEEGQRFYQAIGPAVSRTHGVDGEEVDPSSVEAPWALPLAFHPAGHQLIWQDQQRTFRCSQYTGMEWGGPYVHGKKGPGSWPLAGGILQGGTVSPTPNGLALVHWIPGKPGVEVVSLTSKAPVREAASCTFVGTPSQVPDGGGVVGLVKGAGGLELRFVPLNLPLADVVNAWMFVKSGTEADLYGQAGGLFRPGAGDQLFQMYDSEGYYPEQPTRPYLVTTDIFWENFAAAFEGLFLFKERTVAIPQFWTFVARGSEACARTGVAPHWKRAFKVLLDLRAGTLKDPEVRHLAEAQGAATSTVTSRPFDFGDCMPRGHYTGSEDLKLYFKAFHYLNGIFAADQAVLAELGQLPPETKGPAQAWIGSYRDFISRSRTALALDGPAPGGKRLAVFPLSWGLDNQVLDEAVFHSDRPNPIQGPEGPRILPSGMDLAFVLGSSLAQSLLEPDFKRYPPLRPALARMKDAGRPSMEASKNLYDAWIAALAVQWADPAGQAPRGIWAAKRLQTGLASWTTLRHATVLVNERTVAESGEGGFEQLVTRPPRGYVEADPATFEAVAQLFDRAAGLLDMADQPAAGLFGDEGTDAPSLRQGILRRLQESAAKARLFRGLAEKELAGKPLTSTEYDEILHVGRTAEYNFLVFKSLANAHLALSTPDPMAKVVDIASAGSGGYLLAGVGRPLQWDFVVPFFGRRQIVKGPVYSWYQIVSDRLLDDEAWRKGCDAQPRPTWVRPFLSPKPQTGSPVTGYGPFVNAKAE